MASGPGGSSQQGSGEQVVQEYKVRVPKATKKKFHVMGFATTLEGNKWNQVRMERENNMKEFRAEEDMPKFGAGSEFGRDAKEEARKKKFGFVSKNYNPDDQPWILHLGGKTGKKYKGIRGGGVTENTSYYVFMQAPDGAFEAYPVHEWYNFKPVPCYKALSAEEAEEEFGRRDKVVNFFSIMLKKRLNLKQEEDDPLDGEEKPQKGKKKKKKEDAGGDLKLTDMDDWLSDSDDNSGDENDEKGSDNEDKKKAKKAKAKGKQKDEDKKKKKKKNKGSDDEAMEESDEGDFDDREVDYMSDSSSSSEGEPDEKANRQMKGVEDEEALLKLNVSEDEEEEEAEKQPNGEEKEKKGEEEGSKPAPPDEKAKGDVKAKEKAPKKGASSGESSAESSDSDFDDSKFQSAMFMQKASKKNGGSDNSGNNSRANTPTRMGSESGSKSKRKQLADGSNASSPSKKSKHDGSSASSSTEGITEDSVRRYLMRKPMTTTELLQKFRSKKTGLSGNQLVTTIAQILKRLNPQKQTIKGKLYLSIKQ